jgi:asparagine synthase (glutamine-hydrolysing)
VDVTNSHSAVVEGIASQWTAAVARTVGSKSHLSILFSGGLDSSLVAFGVQRMAEVELVTVGVEGSPDLVAAERGARVLGLPWVGKVVDRLDVDRVCRSEAQVLSPTEPSSRPVLIGLALALEGASNSRVLCGQGADELFLGYAHFEHLSAAETEKKRRADLDRLLLRDWPVSVLLAERRNRELGSPFLDPEFRNLIERVSFDQLRTGEGRKPLLRAVAARLGLPSELAVRPKKAFQYGSGIASLLRSRSVGR